MPGADVDALGRVREVAADHVVGGDVRVLVEEVVLGDPHVLDAGAVGGLDRRELLLERVVLGVGIHVAQELRRVALDEQPELHRFPLVRVVRRAAAVADA